MRLAFLGTPEAAVPSLEALVDAGHDVALVVTGPDRRRGRGREISATPVKRAARERGLVVSSRLDDVAEGHFERAIVVAYGAIVPPELLARVPMLNVHFSLLPRWRGAAPVQRAILAGDVETGVSIISLEPSLDTGPVHLERRTHTRDKSAADLTEELAQLGARAVVEVLATPALLLHPRAQVGEATYARKITKEMLRLSPEMDATTASRTVRLGGVFAVVRQRRLGVVSARPCALAPGEGVVALVDNDVLLGVRGGSLVLDEVLPEGSRPMGARAWWSGQRAPSGELSWA